MSTTIRGPYNRKLYYSSSYKSRSRSDREVTLVLVFFVWGERESPISKIVAGQQLDHLCAGSLDSDISSGSASRSCFCR